MSVLNSRYFIHQIIRCANQIIRSIKKLKIHHTCSLVKENLFPLSVIQIQTHFWKSGNVFKWLKIYWFIKNRGVHSQTLKCYWEKVSFGNKSLTFQLFLFLSVPTPIKNYFIFSLIFFFIVIKLNFNKILNL